MVRRSTPSVSSACATAAPRAAGAELHHAAAGHVREFAPEAFGKARPVGVVPDRAAVLEHDRVHGSERARIRGEVVEERDHRLLAGMGDVEPGETEAPGGGQKLGKRVRREAEGGDVDDLVDIAQALLGALALMQARRARCLDAGADEAGEDGPARSRDSRRASCLLASPGAMRPGRRFQRLRNAHSGGASPGRRFLGGSSDPVNRVLTLFEKPSRPFRVSLGRSGRCLEAGLDPVPNLTTHMISPRPPTWQDHQVHTGGGIGLREIE